MFLQRITLTDFKNIEKADLEFSSNVNCICGNNGEGKTNLLDAIYYLSMTKCFTVSSDVFTLRDGTNESILYGNYIKDELEEKIAISVRRKGEKVIKRNSKKYARKSDHVGLIPVVVVSPSDTSLINDSGEERRKFMNAILSQTDHLYLRAVQAYNRIISQRNKVLKDNNPSEFLLDTLSDQLSKEASYIYEKRKSLIKSLSEEVTEYYKELSGDRENINMKYSSDLDKGSLKDILQKSKQRDKILQYTSQGIQRDDIIFEMKGFPMKKTASQGQQKSFLIAIKLAQFSFMKKLYGFSPILLLDDVFDKLDIRRVENLIKMVASNGFGQIFITDSNKVRLTSIVKEITSENKFFMVKEGQFE
ncbi:MAG: DNA replication and repair protein RecF [Bacteroidales bacterium]